MGKQDYWVTVCDVCGTASCWHGELMCEDARLAGTSNVLASVLLKRGLEDRGNFSPKKLKKVCGHVSYVQGTENMDNKSNDKPWWWPESTNTKEYVNELRENYPDETAGMDDDEVRAYYAKGRPFADTWDHLGDARADYWELADAFLKLVEETGKNPADFFPHCGGK